jgi:hypothetical protein
MNKIKFVLLNLVLALGILSSVSYAYSNTPETKTSVPAIFTDSDTTISNASDEVDNSSISPADNVVKNSNSYGGCANCGAFGKCAIGQS